MSELCEHGGEERPGVPCDHLPTDSDSQQPDFWPGSRWEMTKGLRPLLKPLPSWPSAQALLCPCPWEPRAETLGTVAARPELPLLCMMGSRECEAGSSGVILEEILKARAIKAGGWAVSDVIEI